MSEQVFDINETGEALTLYSDDLVELGGQRQISRASHVEPASEGDGTWEVKLGDDPILGKWAGKLIGNGFTTRKEALEFEVNWINQNILGAR